MGSGSGVFFLSSAKISAVWYGEDDQMIFRRGNVRVSRTRRCWADFGDDGLTRELLVEREVETVPEEEKP